MYTDGSLYTMQWVQPQHQVGSSGPRLYVYVVRSTVGLLTARPKLLFETVHNTITILMNKGSVILKFHLPHEPLRQ